MKNQLKKSYHRQLFRPGFFGLFINPFYIIRSGLYKKIKLLSGEIKGKVIDFGCGSMPYRDLFTVDSYTGIDYKDSGHEHEGEDGKVYYDGKTLPLDSASVDCVFASEVFEHVFNLEEILGELNRVLKPGGNMLITVPFVWEEHEVPYDFARYSSYGITAVLESNGFKVKQLHKSCTALETCSQLFIANLYSFFPRMRLLNLLLTLLIIAPLNIFTVILNVLFPKNDGLYLTNILLVEKVEKNESDSL